MSDRLLLDTCAIIWLSQDQPISSEARSAINNMANNEDGLVVSPISAWEIGLLAARNRLLLPMETNAWFQWFLTSGMVNLADMSVDVLIASSNLPGSPPNDPADRIIIATARAQNMAIITRDQKILDYSDCGFIKSVKC